MRKSTKRFILSLIISFAFALLFTSPMLYFFEGGKFFNGSLLLTILAFLLGFTVCLASCHLIFVFPVEKEEEFAGNWYKAKERVGRYLHSDFYTQVYYRNNTDKTSEDFEMFQKIARNSECKFYAKLNEQEYIELIAKDKNEQIVYKQVIRNFVYFEEYFET